MVYGTEGNVEAIVGEITATSTHITSTEFSTLNTMVSSIINARLGVTSDITTPAEELAEIKAMADAILIRLILQKQDVKTQLSGIANPGAIPQLAEFLTPVETARLDFLKSNIRRTWIRFSDRATGYSRTVR